MVQRQEAPAAARLTLPDSRVLTYEISGDPDGAPIFLHHGMPGSSRGPRPRNAVLYRLGVKLISYNRPGYGGSTRAPGRSVADAAQDVKWLADALGVDRFAVMGRSGGGPHALACAALLPDRVSRAAVLVSFAPTDAVGLRWFAEMGDSNVDAYHTAFEDRLRLEERIRLRADRVRKNPGHLIDELREDMPPADVRIVDDVSVQRLLRETYQKALAGGHHGWTDDVVALSSAWRFSPQKISVPVRFWHGADDRFAPPGHTRWLADQIPDATMEVQLGAAHFGALNAVPELLTWLAVPVAEAPTWSGARTGAGR